MYVLLLAILLLSSVLAVLFLTVQENFDTAQYLFHKTKCFDCERQIYSEEGPGAVWKAQPTKLFDAEAAGVAMTGGAVSGGFIGKTMRFY